MTKNTNQKGNQIEKIAQGILEKDGYKVHRAVRAYRPVGPGKLINISTDVFGCVDLIGKKRGYPTRWVQVTADGSIGRKREQMSAVDWDPVHDQTEVWLWRGQKMAKGMTRAYYLSKQYFDVRSFMDNYESTVAELRA